jgi:hypothetical protein
MSKSPTEAELIALMDDLDWWNCSKNSKFFNDVETKAATNLPRLQCSLVT